MHKDVPQTMRKAQEAEKGKTGAKSQQATKRGKRSLEEAEDRSQSKRMKTQPQFVNFSAKECAAVYTSSASDSVRKLLQGRFKHLVKNQM